MTHGMGGSDSIRAARFLMRTGRSFPVEAHPESASHSGGEFWDAVSASMAVGKPHPAFELNSGMNFPLSRRWESVSHFRGKFRDALSRRHSLGNCIPLWRLIPGCAFLFGAHREAASHSGVPNWDVLSPRAPVGKAHPISASWPVSRAAIGRLSKKNYRLECEFQPVIHSSKCRIDYDCAPSRKKRRLK